MSSNNRYNRSAPQGSSSDHDNPVWRNVQNLPPLIIPAADAAYARRRGLERPFGVGHTSGYDGGHTGALQNDQIAPRGSSRHSTGSATGELYASGQASFGSGSSRHSTGSADFPSPPQLRSHFSTPTDDGRSIRSHHSAGTANAPIQPPQSPLSSHIGSGSSRHSTGSANFPSPSQLRSHFSTPTDDGRSVRHHASASSGPGTPDYPQGNSPMTSIYDAYGRTSSDSNVHSPSRSGANYQGPSRYSSRHSNSSVGSGYAGGRSSSSLDDNLGSTRSSRSGSSQSLSRRTNAGAPSAHCYTNSGSSRSGQP